MNKKLLLYILIPMILVAFVFVMEWVTDAGYMPQLDYMVLYMMRMLAIFVVLSVLVGSFTRFKDNSMMITVSLLVSAMMVLVDYYMNIGNEDSGNLLWFLPMIIVVYVAKYKTITRMPKKEKKN